MGRRANAEFEEWFNDSDNTLTPLEVWNAAIAAAGLNRDQELIKHNEELRKQLRKDREKIFNLKKQYQELEMHYYELEEKAYQKAA
jgi:hypothetical protein